MSERHLPLSAMQKEKYGIVDVLRALQHSEMTHITKDHQIRVGDGLVI